MVEIVKIRHASDADQERRQSNKTRDASTHGPEPNDSSRKKDDGEIPRTETYMVRILMTAHDGNE